MARTCRTSLSHPCHECKGKGPVQAWACHECNNTGTRPEYRPKPLNIRAGYSNAAELRAGA